MRQSTIGVDVAKDNLDAFNYATLEWLDWLNN